MPLVEAKPRIAVKSILFPTDFSERSAAALPYAAALARHYDAKIYLAHVVVCDEGGSTVPPASNRTVAQREMALLDRCDLLNGLRYEVLVEQGELWGILSQMTKACGTDFIVLGTSGGGGFRKLIAGSVAEEIIHEAACPVLAVGPEVPSRTQLPGDMRRIVYAADFQPWSDLALTYAVALAESNRAQLTLVHAVDPDKVAPPQLPMPEVLGKLQSMLPSDANFALPPQLVAETGAAVGIILKVAARDACDLIVMGAREMCCDQPSSPFAWVMLRQILRAARCPVLAVHG